MRNVDQLQALVVVGIIDVDPLHGAWLDDVGGAGVNHSSLHARPAVVVGVAGVAAVEAGATVHLRWRLYKIFFKVKLIKIGEDIR